MRKALLAATMLGIMLMASGDALADSNPCPDGSASIQMQDGRDYCFALPNPAPGETYSAAFERVWGFVPCWYPFVLVEDGSCANSQTFFNKEA